MDENKFFRNITLKLCGHLKIEEGLRACIKYLSQYMPADRLYLVERHDYGSGEMRPLARANTEKCERIERLLHLSEEVKTAMAKRRQAFHTGKLPEVFVHNKPKEELITRCFLEAFGEPSSSVMWLPLHIEGQVGGALILLAEGNDRFEDDHARLFATLKEPFYVAMFNAFKYEEVIKFKDRLADDNRQLQGELLRISGDKIIGADFGLRKVMQQVQQVAPTESIVLLTGETGVGKDVIANAIHLGSPRREGPFIPVNCGAIPDSLLDSELFGHEKGAFTGALSVKRGRFERADKGTILLDEIGEMPLEAQVRLLRVIQHREIERVGGTKRILVDIRIIASTNQDLSKMVKSGRFREDLWFRLNVFPIWIPPLRERKSDISSLLQHFISLKSTELKLPTIPTLSSGAIDPLVEYHWPGNVRELENVIERAMILNPTGPLTFEYLNLDQPKKTLELHGQSEETDNLDEVITRHIRRILSKTKGKVHGADGAAAFLGINPSTLRNRMKKLGIDYGRKSKS
jgi:transcriptional regulator with GAF, ATPase, and Fis domain